MTREEEIIEAAEKRTLFDRSDLQDKTSKVIFKDGQIVTIEDI